MPEEYETFFYPLGPKGLVTKGLNNQSQTDFQNVWVRLTFMFLKHFVLFLCMRGVNLQGCASDGNLPSYAKA